MAGYILKRIFDFRRLTALGHLGKPRRSIRVPLIGLILLSGVVAKETPNYCQRLKAGVFKQ